MSCDKEASDPINLSSRISLCILYVVEHDKTFPGARHETEKGGCTHAGAGCGSIINRD